MYVARRNGEIYGLWTVKQSPGQEELSDSHPDILAFRAKAEDDARKPSKMDTLEERIVALEIKVK